MTFDVHPLNPRFGAEITGLDFAQPLSDSVAAELRVLSAHYGVVVIRNERPPSDEQHIAFGRLFGPVEVGPTFKISGETKKRITNPALVDVSNLDADGNIMQPDNRRMMARKGDRLWHADMTFMDNRATWSLLVGHEIPDEGGDTEFCDMRVALEQLPVELRTMLARLKVSHSIWHSRQLAGFPPPTDEELASRPPAVHPMIIERNGRGRDSLYSASHAEAIVGWPLELGRDLIASLIRFATQPDNVYRHQWRLGDVLMWDNMTTMHRATDFEDTKYRRDMRRVTCRERPVQVASAA